MAYVYRYTDKADGIIKYVGIVWSETRSLLQRIAEHSKYDAWCKGKEWKIEYISENIHSRTDAEYMEAHFVSLFRTGNWYNTAKADWGVSRFIPIHDNWQLFDIERETLVDKLRKEVEYKNSYISFLEDKIEKLEATVTLYASAEQKLDQLACEEPQKVVTNINQCDTENIVSETPWSFIYTTNSLYREGESHKNRSNNDLTRAVFGRGLKFAGRHRKNSIRSTCIPVKAILYIEGKKASVRMFDSILDCSKHLGIANRYISSSLNCMDKDGSIYSNKYIEFNAGSTWLRVGGSKKSYWSKYTIQFCAITPLCENLKQTENINIVTRECTKGVPLDDASKTALDRHVERTMKLFERS